MDHPLHTRVRAAEAALRQEDFDLARQELAGLRREISRADLHRTTLEVDLDRYRTMLQRTLHVALTQGLVPLAAQIVDAVAEIVGAERGFLGLCTEDGWRFVAARQLRGEDLQNPTSQVSTGLIGAALAGRRPVIHQDAVEELGEDGSVGRLNLKSVLIMPLVDEDRPVGFLYLDDPRSAGLFDAAAVDAVAVWLPILARHLAQQAETDDDGLPGVVTRSSAFHAQIQELARLARHDVSVLLTGETGTGKSLVARALHHRSARTAGPFVHLNCGALPEGLLESELFGHKKGSFTGAVSDRVGHLEAAEGGTLFLDELDSMPLSLQARLLVALQERVITRLGESQPRRIDVRLVAALSRDPFDAIEAGRLREDLYYRVAVFVAHLPPLRERAEDIPLLARHLLAATQRRYDLPPLRLSEQAMDALLAHPWPGNVRELANTLDRAALLATDGVIQKVQIQERRRASGAEGGGLLARLEDVARQWVRRARTTPALADWEAGEVFRSLILLLTIADRGDREAGFEALGLGSLVRTRNHTRALKRETNRVDTLATELGEPVPRGARGQETR